MDFCFDEFVELSNANGSFSFPLRYIFVSKRAVFNRCSELLIVFLLNAGLFVSVVSGLTRIYFGDRVRRPSPSSRSFFRFDFLTFPIFLQLFGLFILAVQFLFLVLNNESNNLFTQIMGQTIMLSVFSLYLVYRILGLVFFNAQTNRRKLIEYFTWALAIKSIVFVAILRKNSLRFGDPKVFLLFLAFIFHTIAFLNDLFWHIRASMASSGFRNLENVEENVDLIQSNSNEQQIVELKENDDESGFLSRIFFLWTNPLVKKGYRKQLNSPEDLYPLPEYLLPEAINLDLTGADFHDPSFLEPNFSIARHLFNSFGRTFGILGVFRLVADIVRFFNPILLHALIDSLQQQPRGKGKQTGSNLSTLWIVLLMASSLLISSILDFNFNFYVNKIALRVRTQILLAVYGKILHVPKFAFSHKDFSTGRLLNFVSTDIDRTVNFFTSFHSLWSMPLNLCFALILLYREIGMAFLSGLFAAVALIPLNKLIADKIGKFSTKMMAMKDERLKLVNEFIRAAKPVRLNCWEPFFERKISAIREQELKYLKWRKYLDAICVYLWAGTPTAITLAILVTFIWFMEDQLTTAKIFTTMALVNILILPLNAFPWVLNSMVEGLVTKRRFDTLFSLQNSPKMKTFDNESSYDPENDGSVLLKLQNASFSWSPDDFSTKIVKHLSFSGRKGRIIGVSGPVGAGKSTLLQGILGEALLMGEIGEQTPVEVEKKVAEAGIGYVGQEIWLQRTSVRENILCGREFNQAFYDRVLEACALTSDIEMMPGRDEYLVGNDGGGLSGGQRVRLELARAVYQNFGVYLLDDPFASLDRNVGRHIFRECLRGLLAARGALVIVCTHNSEFIRQADSVIYLHSDLPSIIDRQRNEEIVDEIEKVGGIEVEEGNENGEPEKENEEISPEFVPVQELKEEKQEGTVKLSVYKTYILAVGVGLSLALLVSMTAMQLTRNGSDVWLGYWAKNSGGGRNSTGISGRISHIHFDGPFSTVLRWEFFSTPLLSSMLAAPQVFSFSFVNENPKTSDGEALLIYTLIAFANTIFALIRAFLFAYGGLVAARVIHERLLQRILKAKFSWWDSIPAGRVLNRLSTDVFMVDDSLPFQLNILLATCFALAGVLLVTALALPIILPLAVLLGIAYFFIQRYYRCTTVEVKRLCAITLSPLYNHVNDSIGGLVTIRAHRLSAHFLEKLFTLLRDNLRSQYAQLACSQWLSVRLQLIGVLIVSAIAIGTLLQMHLFGADTALVGLAITYALSITTVLNGLLNSFIETEKELVSVERASEFIEHVPIEEEKEDKTHHDGNQLDTFFRRSVQGRISFVGVSFAYGPGLPPALRDVTFDVEPGQRVAICGRTGSGKSSIFQALMRAYPIDSGKIYIDGVFDISELGLEALRSQFGYVSQTPFIFSGTVRENLLLNRDPSTVDGDAALLSLLEQAGLGDWVSRRTAGGLDSELVESGKGLSLGERQLLCLCRLILARPKIVLIDEATAHVDEQRHTSLMDVLLKMLGRGVTVLSIVHRLTGIDRFDWVIEMANGSIARQGPPRELGLC